MYEFMNNSIVEELDEMIGRQKVKEMDLIKRFFDTINIHVCIGYCFDYSEKELVIYAHRPGIIIGYNGKNIDILKRMLEEDNFDKMMRIRFVEVKGNIINV